MRAVVILILLAAAAPVGAQTYDLKVTGGIAVYDGAGVQIGTESFAELVLILPSQTGFANTISFNGRAPSDLNAEIEALRRAKAALRAALARIDAIALEHIGEMVP